MRYGMMKKQFLALLVILVLSNVMTSAQNKIEVNSIQSLELIQKNNKIVVLDVRTPDEFELGHVKGAQNIDIYQQDFYVKLSKLDKTKTYLVYCRTNRRSGNAVNFMIQNGFKTAYQMMDGFNGWMANKLPEED